MCFLLLPQAPGGIKITLVSLLVYVWVFFIPLHQLERHWDKNGYHGYLSLSKDSCEEASSEIQHLWAWLMILLTGSVWKDLGGPGFLHVKQKMILSSQENPREEKDWVDNVFLI